MRFPPTWTVALLLAGVCVAQAQERHNYKPAQGYVPDAATAIRIAVAVWSPIYGEQQIAKQAPYRAELVDGVWQVSGTLHPAGPGQWVVGGGVAVAEISKDDGKVLRVSHGQ